MKVQGEGDRQQLSGVPCGRRNVVRIRLRQPTLGRGLIKGVDDMARATALVSEPITGDALYQVRARHAFPILVRQANAGKLIFYSDLADELGMSNPRTLNYPLGSIGRTIENLSKVWKEKIPPIQSLVVNKNTGIPGEGIGWFLRALGDFKALSHRQRKELVAGAHALIFAYPRWEDVLRAVSLKPIKSDFSSVVREADQPGTGQGGGEGERHRALKEFVSQNPTCIGLPRVTPMGKNEVPLPSGDSLDVSFRHHRKWIAAEVKTALSDTTDIVRGLFQCVKYRAVMEAVQASEGYVRDARSVLVLEGRLPRNLVPLRNILGVEVYESVG